MSRDVIQQLVDALERMTRFGVTVLYKPNEKSPIEQAGEAIEAGHRELKKPAVAWMYEAKCSSGAYSESYFEWRVTLNKSQLEAARKFKPLYE